MATIAAAAGGGNWDAGATWVGGVVPTSADDVTLISTSGPVTIPAAVTALCRSLICSGYTNTFTFAATTSTLNVGDASGGNLGLSSSMTLALTGIGTINMVSTSSNGSTGWYIDSFGKTLPTINFNGVGGKWRLQSNVIVGSTTTVSLINGTFTTNGYILTTGIFSVSGTGVRRFTSSTGGVTLTGTGTTWDATTTTNLTIDTGAGTITFTTASTMVTGGATFTYPNIAATNAGAFTISGGLSCAGLTRTGTTAKTDSLVFGGPATITNAFTVNGNSAINRMDVKSSTHSSQRIITAGSTSFSNVDFTDISGAGAGNWSIASITGFSGDGGGNSGITFTAGITCYWVSNTGLWSDVNEWKTTSGGATNARVPLPQDDVVFDASSITTTAQTVTLDVPRAGRNITWTGVLNNPIFATGSTTSLIYGSLTLVSGMTRTGTGAITFSGRGSYSITTAGVSLPQVLVTASGGTYTLLDALASGSTVGIVAGSFDSSSYSISATAFNSTGSLTRAITLGTSTLTLSLLSGTIVNIVASGLTFSGASSTIVVASASASARTIVAGSQSYGTITYTVPSSTGSLSMATGTINTLNISGGSRTWLVGSGGTHTITNWNVFGTAGNLVTVASTIAGNTAYLSKAGAGVVDSDYLSIQDISASPASTWYAGLNSVNVSNNSGWTFTDAPVQSTTTGNAPVNVGSSSSARNSTTTTGTAPIDVGSSSSVSLIAKTTGNAPVTSASSSSTKLIPVLAGTAPVSVFSSSSVLYVRAEASLAPVNVNSSSSSLLVAKSTSSTPVNVGSSSASLLIAKSTATAPINVGSSSSAFIVLIAKGTAPVSAQSSSASKLIASTSSTAPVSESTSSVSYYPVDITPYTGEATNIVIPVLLSGYLDAIFPEPVPPVNFAGLTNPTVAPTVTKSDTADGHLPAGTYRYTYAAWKGTPSQATAPSPSVDITLTTEDTVTLTYPTISGADGYLVYREDL